MNCSNAPEGKEDIIQFPFEKKDMLVPEGNDQKKGQVL